MIGLALEGGGAKGAYQVGAYKAMLECGIKINGVTGTSIGAFNAALIASNDFDKLEKFWREEDISKLLGFLDDDIITKLKIFEGIKDILIPLKTYFLNKGLSPDYLIDKLNSLVDEHKIRNSKLDYGLVTVRLKDRKPLYLYKEDIPDGKLTDYIIASCYLPVFKPKVLDGDSYYLDGGFYDNSPSYMLDNKGYKKIYVISLNAIAFNKKHDMNAEIIKIKPTRTLGMVFDVSKKNIEDSINMGYYDALRIIKNLDGRKYVFKRKSNWFYDLLVRKVSKKTKERALIFFMAKNNKDLVLKALEYCMTKEKMCYNQIYKPYKVIKMFKKVDKNLIAYKLLKELKIF